MKVEIEELEPCKKAVRVEIPKERVDEAFSQIYQQLKKEVRIPGFRPGKAPVSIIRARFGDYAKSQVMESLVKEAYEKVLEENKLSPYGEPEIKDVDFDEGKPFTFTLEMEVNPDFELKDYTQIEVEKKRFVITDEYVEKFLNELREQHAVLEDKEGPAQMGDVVLIEYTVEGGDLDEELKGGDLQSATVLLGEGKTLPGFDEQVVGKKKGEEFEVEITYPEDYEDKRFAGKRVVFKCKLKGVKKRVLPEIDEEFAKKFGVDSVEALKEKARAELEKKFEEMAKRLAQDEILAKMAEQYDFPVPPSAVERMLDQKIKDYELDLRVKGIEPDEEELKRKREELRGEVIKLLRLNYVLKRIAQEEGIEVTRGDVEAQLEDLSSRTRIPVENIVEVMRATGRLSGMVEDILISKVLDHLLGKVKVKEVEVTPEEAENKKEES